MIAINPLTGDVLIIPEFSMTSGVTSVNGRTGIVTLAKADVGLSVVDNTTDLGKPLSTVAISALAAKADLIGGVIPTAQIPAIAITEFLGSVASQVAMLALTGQKGDWCIRTDTALTWIITGADPTQLSSWTPISYPGSGVASVNGKTGVVVLNFADVGAQPLDFTLTALANVVTAANKLIYATGSDAFATTDFSAFGRSLVDDADDATARLTLGLGSVAFTNDNNIFSMAQTIDLGAIGATPTDGLVIRNSVAGTLGVPLQHAPQVVFEANGFGGGINHQWEMNEAFTTYYLLTSHARLTWQFQENGGGYVDKQYIDSGGNLATAGGVYASAGFTRIDNLVNQTTLDAWTSAGIAIQGYFSGKALLPSAVLFANRIAASNPGMMQVFTDSPTNVIGAVISAGGGANTVMAWWTGTEWHVAMK